MLALHGKGLPPETLTPGWDEEQFRKQFKEVYHCTVLHQGNRKTGGVSDWLSVPLSRSPSLSGGPKGESGKC